MREREKKKFDFSNFTQDLFLGLDPKYPNQF